MSIRAQSLISCLHHISLNPTTRLPPPPSQFERNCLCPTPTRSSRAQSPVSILTMSIRAQLLVSHRVNSSTTARVPPPPRQFEPDRSCPTPTVSIQAQPALACFLPPRLFKPDRSCPTSTMSSQARPPMSCSHRVNSVPIACVPPSPRLFEADRSSPTPTASIRAQPLVSHFRHVLSIPIADE